MHAGRMRMVFPCLHRHIHHTCHVHKRSGQLECMLMHEHDDALPSWYRLQSSASLHPRHRVLQTSVSHARSSPAGRPRTSLDTPRRTAAARGGPRGLAGTGTACQPVCPRRTAPPSPSPSRRAAAATADRESYVRGTISTTSMPVNYSRSYNSAKCKRQARLVRPRGEPYTRGAATSYLPFGAGHCSALGNQRRRPPTPARPSPPIPAPEPPSTARPGMPAARLGPGPARAAGRSSRSEAGAAPACRTVPGRVVAAPAGCRARPELPSPGRLRP
jgi:hypothetical protein